MGEQGCKEELLGALGRTLTIRALREVGEGAPDMSGIEAQGGNPGMRGQKWKAKLGMGGSLVKGAILSY